VSILITNSLIERAGLTLTSADISFSPVNPAAGQTVTMTARVHNAGHSRRAL
jgi:hypothetical protein